jgi:MoxR-like ATPase
MVTLDELRRVLTLAQQVVMPRAVENYLLDLVEATRRDGRLIRGVSTRGAQGLYRAARTWALVQGRSVVVPDEVVELAVPVLAHRVVARAAGPDSSSRVIGAVLEALPVP